MFGKKHLLLLTLCTAIAGTAAAVVAPKDGGTLPKAVRELNEKNRRALPFMRAWAQKARGIRQQRESFVAVNGPQALSAISAAPQEYAVTGTLEIPVLLCEFANRPGAFDSLAVQNKLFDAASGTVTDYWDEVSYGLLNMTGTVYDWVTLANNDAYYEGLPGCNGTCSSAPLGELLFEVLSAKDGVVDFSQYDNDGPDGVPNTSDDDGFVDFVAIVHSEYGGECTSTTNNMWSHNASYAGVHSSEQPYETDDPAAGGGFIKINEYTMQPLLNCPPENANLNDIGVYCHEFGHAMGLPDLYDWNYGGGSGIGYWGIMGSGNWNMSDSPAHPCAWTRMQMGWVTPTDMDWQGGLEAIAAIATSREVFRFGFSFDRFRRSNECRINGSYSLYCGYHQAEGFARGWGNEALDRGYGNTWNETIEREFTYDGTTPVDFSYEFKYDAEATYDFCYTIVEVGGVEHVLDQFTGIGSGSANHDISSRLSGLPAGTTYKIKFRGVSDYSWSDEDVGGGGNFNSNCGMFVVDDVAVSGGGESYFADFETFVDGWYQANIENHKREYWLAENRQVAGYDAHLKGTGLLIMHIDETIIEAPFLGNSGGPDDGRVKGVVVEEADGLNQLGTTSNRGDAGDIYPGTSNNRNFNSSTNPSSKNNSGGPTEISILNISNSGATMTATVKAGDPGPTVTSVSPTLIDNNTTQEPVAITGDNIAAGATFYFTLSGAARSGPSRAPADGQNIDGTSLQWVDPTEMNGVINPYSKEGGSWDLVVVNPDGQEYVLGDAITMNQIVAAQLQSATIEVDGQAIRLEYELFDQEPGEKIRLSRSTREASLWNVIENDLRPVSDDGFYVYVDDDVEPGKNYFYKLEVVAEGGEVRELHRGSAAVPAGDLKLSQNFPNPFNPTTTIAFYLPDRVMVRLEVFDVAGRVVTRLGDGIFDAGPHNLTWNGTDANGTQVSSGMYVYRLTVGNRTISKKMILLK
jgi:M6 family metalloprotease-like protein